MSNENLDIFLQKKGVELTEEQYNYVYDVCFGDSPVDNWSVAGSGKSLCLELIKEFLGDSCVVVAMTGAANSNLFNCKGGNGTFNSVMSIPLGIHNHYHEKKVSPKTRDIFSKSDIVRVVIVEEAGMMNPDQLSLFHKRILQYNKPYGKKRKRRNIKIVLQGDHLQLGSISSDEEKEYYIKTYGSDFLPESSIYKELGFNTHIFSKVMRTSDKTFQAALGVMRYGEEQRYDKCIRWLNQRFQKAPDNCLVVTTTNKKVEEMNERELAKNPNQLFELTPIIRDDYDIKDCPVDAVVRVKVGSPVLILVNDNEENKYHNGSYGHVTQICVGEGVYVRLALNDEEVFVPMFKYEAREYYTDTNKETGEDFMNQRVIGECHHYSIKLASAISVHRCQGKTLDVPYLLDLGWGFNPRQDIDWGMQLAYVGWSRATKFENVYLASPMNHKHIKVNERAVKWVKTILRGCNEKDK